MMELVYMYQQNKNLVIEVFIKEKFSWLKRVIFSHCDHKMIEQYMDELIQISLVKLAESFDCFRYDKKQDFLSYYYLVIKRMILDFKKSLYRQIRKFDYYTTMHSLNVENREVEYLSAIKIESIRNYDLRQKCYLIVDLLKEYSDTAQMVIYYKVQGYHLKEIAQMLGINEYKVNYIVRKVRKQLKNKIDESNSL